MQVVAHKLGAADKLDRFVCVRDDGSQTQCAMPRQGILPHDLIHFVVETRLGLSDAFLGMVATGSELDFAMQRSHQLDEPGRLAQAGQAESLVEALQTQLWAGAFERDAFDEALRGACAMRGVPTPALDGVDVAQALFDGAIELNRQWAALPYHSAMHLRFA